MVKKNLINAYKFWVNKIFHLKSSNYIDEESYMYLFKLIQYSFIREILYSIEYTEEDSTQITRLIETHLKTFTDRYSSELNQDYLFQDQHFIEILTTQKFHILSSKPSQSDTGLQPETQFSFICVLVKPNN